MNPEIELAIIEVIKAGITTLALLKQGADPATVEAERQKMLSHVTSANAAWEAATPQV